MATQEIVVDQKPVDLAPVDTNVVVPKYVREAAARAEAAHNAAYAAPQAEGTPAPEEPSAPVVQEVPPNAAPPTAPEAAAAQPQPPVRSTDVDWEQRFNSMKGRWQANERMLGEMRSQMDQMAVELRRSQDLLNAPQHAQNQPTSDKSHGSLITPDERETYGDDMINVARKAAIEALTPELQQIQQQNEQLRQQLLQQQQGDLRSLLSQSVPNWRSIVNTQEWKDWLRLPNVYTGEVRGKVLDAAYKAANSSRVIAIFNEYVRDIVATGGQLPGQQVKEQPIAAPRQPAVPLASLTSPGRARPSSGELPTSVADKPIYTRQQIANFYADVRRARSGNPTGPFVGRETELVRIEQDISAAQREGRVR